jgi:hypothetical protein
VFAVIHEALAALARENAQAAKYASVRCPQVAAEIAEMGEIREDLTPDGAALWERLVSGVRGRSPQTVSPLASGQPSDGAASGRSASGSAGLWPFIL